LLLFHVENRSKKATQSCNTTTEHLGKRRARAGALIGGIVTTIVIVSPNMGATLFESIRSQNGANKRQRCAIIDLFHADSKGINHFSEQNVQDYLVPYSVISRELDTF